MNPIFSSVALFQNLCPANVAATLTFTASDFPVFETLAIENVSSDGVISNFLILYPGQTITAVFDVSSGGGFLQGASGLSPTSLLPVTWQLENVI
jgi:hypothetical protein